MPLRVVLDTNVALDLIVFGDPGTQSLDKAVRSGEIAWVSSPKCRSEFRRVIEYPVIDRFLQRLGPKRPPIDSLMADFDSLTTAVSDPAEPMREVFRCGDRADQFLIDLAINAKVDLLVSKDLKVLQVGKTLRKYGESLRIVPPSELISALAGRCR